MRRPSHRLLPVRRLCNRALVEQRKSVEELQQILPARKFVGIPSTESGDDFRAAVAEMRTPNGASYNPRRFYFGDSELFKSDGKTWALSNQWSAEYLPLLDRLLAKYPEAGISYCTTAQEPS